MQQANAATNGHSIHAPQKWLPPGHKNVKKKPGKRENEAGDPIERAVNLFQKLVPADSKGVSNATDRQHAQDVVTATAEALLGG